MEITKAPLEERKPLVEALQTASLKKSSKPKSKVTTKPTMSAGKRKATFAAIQKIFKELARPKPPLTLHGTVERKVGNTWDLVETACNGNESLAGKVKQLIFSDKEARAKAFTFIYS